MTVGYMDKKHLFSTACCNHYSCLLSFCLYFFYFYFFLILSTTRAIYHQKFVSAQNFFSCLKLYFLYGLCRSQFCKIFEICILTIHFYVTLCRKDIKMARKLSGLGYLEQETKLMTLNCPQQEFLCLVIYTESWHFSCSCDQSVGISSPPPAFITTQNVISASGFMHCSPIAFFLFLLLYLLMNSKGSPLLIFFFFVLIYLLSHFILCSFSKVQQVFRLHNGKLLRERNEPKTLKTSAVFTSLFMVAYLLSTPQPGNIVVKEDERQKGWTSRAELLII